MDSVMTQSERMNLELADPSIYEADQKLRLIKTLEDQRNIQQEERALMKEWDELTTAIEQVERA